MSNDATMQAQNEAIPSHEAMQLRPKGTHLSSRDTGDELGQQGGEVKALGAANLQTALDRIRAQRIRSNACSIGRRGTVEECGGVELEHQTNCTASSGVELEHVEPPLQPGARAACGP